MKRIYFIGTLFLNFLILSGQNFGTNSSVIDAYGKYYGGKFAASEQAFDQLLSTTPLPKYYLMKGIAAFKAGDRQSAVSALDSAANGGESDAYYWLAKLKVLNGNKSGAVNALKSYLSKSENANVDSVKKDKAFASLYGSNAWFDLWQTDWGGAERKIIGNTDYYLKNKNFTKAHQVIENKLNTGLKDDKLLALNAQIYYKEKNLPLAINQISEALAKSPDNTTYQLQKADYLAANNNNTEAYQIVSSYLRHHPGNFPERLREAQLAYKIGKLDEAQKEVDTYMKYIDNPNARYLKGKICYASGKYLDALKQFNILLKSDQSKAKYFQGRGLTYLKTHTYEFASKDLSMSLDLEPDNGETNYYMGVAEHNLGNNKMACYYWNRAKTYGYNQAIEYLLKYCKQ